MIVPVTVCIITLPPTGGPHPAAAAAAAAAEAEAAAQEVRDWGISQVCRYSVAGDKRRVILGRCLCTLRVKCWGSTPQQCPSPPHARTRSLARTTLCLEQFRPVSFIAWDELAASYRFRISPYIHTRCR